jgi:hypothetical protein
MWSCQGLAVLMLNAGRRYSTSRRREVNREETCMWKIQKKKRASATEHSRICVADFVRLHMDCERRNVPRGTFAHTVEHLRRMPKVERSRRVFHVECPETGKTPNLGIFQPLIFLLVVEFEVGWRTLGLSEHRFSTPLIFLCGVVGRDLAASERVCRHTCGATGRSLLHRKGVRRPVPIFRKV